MREYKRYSFEFLSIFIAVISAFALNNWNDNRINRNAESKILLEIRSGLIQDMADIEINVLGHQAGLKAIDYFRRALFNEPVEKDSFYMHYVNLTRDFVSIQNVSGYETLKSKGLELILDDSLRTKIISLYEYDYTVIRKLEEEYHENQFQKSYFHAINDLIAPYVKYYGSSNTLELELPIRLTERERKLFLIYLWKIEFNRNYMIHLYEEVENKVLELSQAISG